MLLRSIQRIQICDGDGSSDFIEENGELSLIEEDIILSLVANKGAEVLADHAVPIGAVLLVKLLLDMLGHQVLHLQVVHRVLRLNLTSSTSFIA